ncbi:MAG TPA: Ig-like domain-containing protein [Vicinamibacterales bacterium]|nr:Ig-like domain-containing protein [Vicinamibacterales bacterium]
MHAAPILTGRAPIALAFILSLLTVSSVQADSITVQWDASGGTVTGYAVYVGSAQRIDVGNTTLYTLPTAVAGQQYCFAVAAYNSMGEGPKSGQVCGHSNQFPSLTNPGSQSGKVGQAASLQLSGSDPDGQAVTYSATGLPPGLFVGTATGFVSGTPTTAGTYSVTASVYDGVLQSAAQTFSWSVASAPAADTTAPSIAISSPTSGPTFTSSTAMMALNGSSSDDVGVTSVSWANDRGGSGMASGTTSWGIPSIGLQTGANVITVTARDAAGNVGIDVLTVTHTVPDTTAPSVAISGPTASPTHTATSSAMTISGTAADAVGVTQVSWVNDRGGSGTAAGTSNWSASGIVLQSGANVITVTARDAAGNGGTDALTVTYTPPDTTVPTITIMGPTTSSSYSTASSVVTIGGNSSDNMGVTAVTWTNNRGGSGFSSGTTSWSVPSVPLQGGSNVITVTAQDAAGNKGTDVLTVNYTAPDTTVPTIAITGPTSSPTSTTTSSTLTMSGTAADNVGVTQVAWSNNRGGSGTATGTGSWSVPAIALQSGSNIVTVTARDASGNLASDVLTVTYNAPDATVPTIAISGPTSSSTHTTTSATLTMSGTASDDVGITQVVWSNDRGGSGTATGTGNWSVSAIALQSGTNVITVTARDAAGNQASDVLTVTSALASAPPSSELVLAGQLYSSGGWSKALLQWRWPTQRGKKIDVYRDGMRLTRTSNDGSYTDSVRGTGPFNYRICVAWTSICSNVVTLSK